MARRIRIASAQFALRSVPSFSAFADQVRSVVHTAADNGCDLLLLPEYFSGSLLSLVDGQETAAEQFRAWAAFGDDTMDLLASLATESEIYLAGGSIVAYADDQTQAPRDIVNLCHFFGPSGQHGVQGKVNMTRFEHEDVRMTGRGPLQVFYTPIGRLAINICYDVEFPLVAHGLAQQGLDLLLVPSCTEDRTGFWRVRYCCHARAVEHQLFVVNACSVGGVPERKSLSLHYGQSSILSPSDYGFARDGIVAEGTPNAATLVIGEVDLEMLDHVRRHGTVLNAMDQQAAEEHPLAFELVEW